MSTPENVHTEDHDNNDAHQGTDAPADDVADTDDVEFTPPTREEWEKTTAALAKANSEAKKHRLENKRLKTAHETPTEGSDPGTNASIERKYKALAIRATARAAFMDAGLNDATPERVGKLLRLIDAEGVDIDDDGDAVGLSDQIEAIKTDYPELFGTKDDGGRRTRTPRLQGADRQAAPQKPKSSAERIATAFRG